MINEQPKTFYTASIVTECGTTHTKIFDHVPEVGESVVCHLARSVLIGEIAEVLTCEKL